MASSSDPECSILALAAEKTQVFNFLELILKDDSSIDDSATSVPWTLANKYYTADVRFVVGELSRWTPVEEELQRIPAVLFIWTSGQPYRQLAKDLSRKLSHHAFEVALAIRLAPSDGRAASDQEDVQDVDAYLSSLGFEFVDAADPVGSDRHGIPGIPRIMDALGTVIWPSMVQRATRHDNPLYQGRTALSKSDHNIAAILRSFQPLSRDTGMRKELEELERWLSEDTSVTDAETGEPTAGRDYDTVDPWNAVVTSGHTTPHASIEASSGSRPSTPRFGFDDDFTAFVSAPPPSDTATTTPRGSLQDQFHDMSPPASTSFSSTFSFDSAASTPVLEGHTSFDTNLLTPGNASYGNGVSYRSLGSVSDFGDVDGDASPHECTDAVETSEDEDGDKNEDDDVELPSKAEIAETSRRIFGTAPFTTSPTDTGPATAEYRSSQTSLLSAEDRIFSSFMEKYGGDNEDADLGRFDLQGILNSLQGLKDEIAYMADDKERRKAAARVALGLVYGLDAGGDF
ncbi:hypothetical protein EDD17DRAFT_1186272 [Pisolithus thermaeus]|nr:hypothetical protein EDD17DRAFT_1186272 [Pisolithus thermaeus]